MKDMGRPKGGTNISSHSKKRILEKAKSTATPILWHSDQGVQYSSAGYCKLIILFCVCYLLTISAYAVLFYALDEEN